MSTSWYLIEPQAPLVFRSGKPFGIGSRDGANFPWPSALAGLLRAQIVDARGLDPRGNSEHLRELLALACAGPLPVERNAEGRIVDVWLPKPADAVLLKDEASGRLAYHRLAPKCHADGTGSDLPTGLMPVSFDLPTKGKPQPGPLWWPRRLFLDWMAGASVDHAAIAARCERTPWQVATRTHLGIDRATFAAESGKLFQTEGLDFAPTRCIRDGRPDGWEDHRFDLLACGPDGIPTGTVTFGGERRLSWLSPLDEHPLPPSSDLASSLGGGVALTLLTPALFADGWKPQWLDAQNEGEPPETPGLRLRLHAAVLDRWQAISGWDLAKQQPRASRKAVPAGATYWFEILAATPAQLELLWLARLSDKEQDRRDGFGLALPRAWNSALSGGTA